MKKTIFTSIIIIFLAPLLIYADSGLGNNSFSPPLAYELNSMKIIPDVMGKINTLEYKGNSFRNVIMQVDSFPNFPGFPLHLSGSSFEGGILCNMNSDNNLEIVYNTSYSVNVVKIDGTPVTGWPKSISPYAIQGAPAFGDIDGDGQGEIVVTTAGLNSGGYIYAWHKDGSVVSGFPVSHGYTTRTPVLADIDNDGKMEIIVSLRSYPIGSEYVYKGNGTVYPGWPKTLNHVPASSAAVGDIDGDGFPEIIAESYIAIYAWKSNGDSIPGFPFLLPGSESLSYSSPVLADVDGDGFREIIFGTHNTSSGGGKVFILKKDGSVLTGWPNSVGNWIYGPPSIGYIDNDNILDITVGDQVLSANPSDFAYAWNKNGTLLSGFPIGPINAINNQISLIDLNNDNHTDLMFDDNTTDLNGHGKYLAYKYDGTPLPGWPIVTTGTTFFQTPCFGNVNNSGILDIVGGSLESPSSNTYTDIYLWNTSLPYNPSKIITPVWQYNTRHNGVYGDNDLVKIEEPSTNVPEDFSLAQNYPNPFNPSTTIEYRLPSSARFVTLEVYDELGQKLSTLVSGIQNGGSYKVTWDGSKYSSGVYFYKLSTGNFSDTKKMLMIK